MGRAGVAVLRIAGLVVFLAAVGVRPGAAGSSVRASGGTEPPPSRGEMPGHRTGQPEQGRDKMTDVVRVSAEDTRARVSRGEALLVCAYDDPDRFRAMHLEGAISLEEFRAMAPSLDRAREIIFYCS